MPPFRHPGARRRAIALVLITLTVGCTSWQTAQVTPQVLLETEKPKSVRVTSRDDARQMVRGPRIAADTLRGLRGWTSKDSVAVAVTDIRRIERQRVSPARTVALLVILGGGRRRIRGDAVDGPGDDLRVLSTRAAGPLVPPLPPGRGGQGVWACCRFVRPSPTRPDE